MKKHLLLFLLTLFSVFAVSATDAEITITSKTAVSATGLPAGASVSYSQSYTTAKQMIGGENATMTISGMAGYKITGVQLQMKSNKSSGAGELAISAGLSPNITDLASIPEGTPYNTGWSNDWASNYQWITINMSNPNYVIQPDENLVIYIKASANSLYWQAAKITYAAADDPGNGGGTSGDVLNKDSFPGLSGSTYSDFSITGASGASYKGATQLSNNVINLKNGSVTNGNYCAIFGSHGSKTVKSISIKNLKNGSANSRKLQIFGSNTAFSTTVAPSGTPLKEFSLTSSTPISSDSYTFDGSYKCFAIVANGGALNVEEIVIEWNDGSTPPVVEPATLTDAEFAWSDPTASATMGETNTFPTLTNTHGLTVTYDSSDSGVATIDASGNITLVGAGSTEISAAFAGNSSYAAKTVTYTLTVSAAAISEPPTASWVASTYATAHSWDHNSTHDDEVITIDPNVSFKVVKGSSDPAYNSGALRIYNTASNGSTLTVTPKNNATVTKIVFHGGDKFANFASVTPGSIVYDSTAKTITWTGSATGNIVFTCPSTGTQQIHVTSIDVFYTTPDPVDLDADDLKWSAGSKTIAMDGDLSSLPTLTNNKNLPLTFSSTTEATATISDAGVVSLVAPGSTTIKAIFDGNAQYNAKTVSYSLTVNPAAPTFTYNGSAATGNAGNPLMVSSGDVINIVAADGADVYYTIDGKAPSNTNGTAGRSVTVTGEDGTTLVIKAIAVQNGKQSSQGTITVKFATAPPVETPCQAPYFEYDDNTLTGSAILEADSEIYVITEEAGAIVTVTANPASAAVIEENGTSMVGVTVNASCVLTAVASKDGSTNTQVTLNVTVPVVPSTGDKYVLVTNASDLKAGDEIILAAEKDSQWKAVKTQFTGTSASNEGVIDVVFNGNKITYAEGVSVFTVVATGNSEYPIALKYGNYYIGYTGNRTDISAKTDFTSTGFSLKYDPTSTSACIVCSNTNTEGGKYLGLNISGSNAYTRFYKTTSSYPPFKIFKKEAAAAAKFFTGEYFDTQISGTYLPVDEMIEIAVSVPSGSSLVSVVSDPAIDNGRIAFDPITSVLTLMQDEGNRLSTVTITATTSLDSNPTLTRETTLVVKMPEYKSFTLVTAPGEVVKDAKYVIASANAHPIYVVSSEENASAAKLSVVSVSEDKVNIPSIGVNVTSAAEFTLVQGTSADKYALQYADGKYLAATVNGTEMYTVSDSKNTNTDITITQVANGYAHILFTEVNRKIAYDDNLKFSSVTSEGSPKVYLYKYDSRTNPGLTWSAESYTFDMASDEDPVFPTLSWTEGVTLDPNKISYKASNNYRVNIDAATGEITLRQPGTVTITASYAGDDTYAASFASYTLVIEKKQADDPVLTVSESAQQEGSGLDIYYINAPFDVTLAPKNPSTETVYYTTTGGSLDQNLTSETTLTITGPTTISYYATSTQEGYRNSEQIDRQFKFRPAKPTHSFTSIAADEDIIDAQSVTITSTTIGATILYSLDNGASWLTYTTPIEFHDMGTFPVQYKAVKEGWDIPESDVVSFSVTVVDKVANTPFTLVTDASALEADMEIVIAYPSGNTAYAMAPYASGDYTVATTTSLSGNNNEKIKLQEGQTDIEIFTIEYDENKTDDYKWRFAFNVTERVEGVDTQVKYYLNCNSTSRDAKINKVDENSDAATSYAKITVTDEGVATIEFQTDLTRKYLQYNLNGSVDKDRFSCYAGTMSAPSIYSRSAVGERTQRPIADPGEGVFTVTEFPTSVTISCPYEDPEHTVIMYTTDGTVPSLTNGTQVANNRVTLNLADLGGGDCVTITAMALAQGKGFSELLVASYHKFTGDKVFTRVTASELQNLSVNDEVIILASPNGTDYYGLGRKQINNATGKYREGVKLTNRPDDNGTITLVDMDVQTLTLMDAVDEHAGYDWRLYASGCRENNDYDNTLDGFLYSQGAGNTLETIRILSIAQAGIVDSEVRFLTLDRDGIGNDFGGVTLEFGALPEHAAYPSFMCMRKAGDNDFRFSCYTGDAAEGEELETYYVSMFKAYNPNEVAAPTFTPDGPAISDIESVSISCVNPGATIMYAVVEGAYNADLDPSTLTFETYTGPISLSYGKSTVYAYTQTATGESAISHRFYNCSSFTIYELVTDASTITENDRLIVVSAEKFDINKRDVGETTGGYYYTLSTQRRENGNTPYYIATKLEQANADGTELIVNSDDDVLVMRVQHDASGVAIRPYLFEKLDPEAAEPSYIQVTAAKDFTFVPKPADLAARAKMNAGIIISDAEGKYMDPDLDRVKNSATYGEWLETFTERTSNDYYGMTVSSAVGATTLNWKATGTRTLPYRCIIIFSGTLGESSKQESTLVRFNPTGNYIHFNAYTMVDMDEEDGKKQNTFPVRLYRAKDRVLEPAITVYPKEGPNMNSAYSQSQTVFPNAVRVEINSHILTDPSADLYYAWSETREAAPLFYDYTKSVDKHMTVYVDGHDVYAIDDQNTEYHDKLDAPAPNGTHWLRALSALDAERVSPSAIRHITFQTIRPRITKAVDQTGVAEGYVRFRIECPETYTKGAQLAYIVVDDASSTVKPNLEYTATYNDLIVDGNHVGYELVRISEDVAKRVGTPIGAYYSDDREQAATAGYVEVPAGKVLRVGAFKYGYEPSFIDYDDKTAFPECRPMQLLRLTQNGCNAIGETFSESSPVYVNYRNDDIDLYYVIKKVTMPVEGNEETQEQHISLKTIAKAVFDNMFNDRDNYLWTTDYFVFTLNENKFKDQEVYSVDAPTAINTKVVDGTTIYEGFQTDVQGMDTKYYGAILENRGSIGTKTLTTKLSYTCAGKNYNTEAAAEITPEIPKPYDVHFLFEYDQPSVNLTTVYPGKKFMKLSVPSAVKENTNCEVLMPISKLDPRQLHAVLKFTRPNISPVILDKYDIYYTIKFNSVNEEDENNVTRAMLPGSGIYVDKEYSTDPSDDVYRFRVDNVSPYSKINPEIEIVSTVFYGNDDADQTYGTFTANYTKEGNNQSIIAKNHSRRVTPTLEELWIGYNWANEDKTQVNWLYAGHKDLVDTDVLVDSDPYNETTSDVDLDPKFYHVETYIPDTDYYQSYEYLVEHIDGHLDESRHPGGYSMENDPDPLQGTVIATNFPGPTELNGQPAKPHIVFAPVYVFNHQVSADAAVATPEQVANGETGTIGVEFLRPLSGTSTNATPAPAKAPKFAPADETLSAPSTATRPMPAAGSTDMNHATIHDATNDPAYSVVKGGHYDTANNSDGPLTGIEDVTAAANGNVEYFNLQGQRVERPAAGFYIRRNADGTATKVLVK